MLMHTAVLCHNRAVLEVLSPVLYLYIARISYWGFSDFKKKKKCLGIFHRRYSLLEALLLILWSYFNLLHLEVELYCSPFPVLSIFRIFHHGRRFVVTTVLLTTDCFWPRKLCHGDNRDLEMWAEMCSNCRGSQLILCKDNKHIWAWFGRWLYIFDWIFLFKVQGNRYRVAVEATPPMWAANGRRRLLVTTLFPWQSCAGAWPQPCHNRTARPQPCRNRTALRHPNDLCLVCVHIYNAVMGCICFTWNYKSKHKWKLKILICTSGFEVLEILGYLAETIVL